MNYRIDNRPNYSVLEIDLEPGEILVTESGAMMAKSTHVTLEPSLTVNPHAGTGAKLSSLLTAGMRKILGGESLLVTHFSTPQPGRILVAPTYSGDIAHHRLDGNGIFLSSSAYLASIGNIDVSVKWGGIKGLLSKEGFFQLFATGTGDLWFSSFGGIEPIDIDGEFVIDNGHLVAWDPSLKLSFGSAGSGLMARFASGEGLVCNFSGKGRVYIQTRNIQSFADWINNFY